MHIPLNPPEMCVVVASLHRKHEIEPIEKGVHMILNPHEMCDVVSSLHRNHKT
jgi:hypothetical protein